MVQAFFLTEGVNEFSVGSHVLVVPLDSVVELGFDFEEQAEVGVSDVEGLVYLMFTGQDNFYVQRYRLRNETLCTCNTEPLSSFFNRYASTLKSSLEPVV